MSAAFDDRDGVIWIDGELVDWRDAKVHVLTHTLHYGLGVFEGVRAYSTDKGPVIFRLDDHTNRLFRSAHILNMEMPFTKEQISEAQKLVIRENNLDEGYLRPMCFYGSEGMGLRAEGLKTHCIIAGWEWPNYMSPEATEEGIKVRTSSFTRHHVNITMCKAKANGNYINSMMALKKRLIRVAMKRYCWTTKATWRKAVVKMYFSFKTASWSRLNSHPALKVSLAPRFLIWRQNLT